MIGSVHFLLFVLDRRQDQLHFTQIGHRVAEDERIVILEVEFNRRTEGRALGKENKMFELEETLDNLVGRRVLLDFDSAIVFRNDGLLFREVTHTLEDEIATVRSNLYIQFLTKRIHIAADLLDIRRR